MTQISKPLTSLPAILQNPSWPPPVWLMRQAGRYLPEYRELRTQEPNFIKFCLTPSLTVEAALQPIRRYDLDAAILFSDILMLPYAMGCDVRFVEGKGPVLQPVRTAADLQRLDRPEWRETLQPVFDSIRMLRQALPAHKSLIGFAGAPWTVACYMIEGAGSRGFDTAKIWAWQHPELFRHLIDLLIDRTVDYLIGQIDEGADLIQLFDSWAGTLPDIAIKEFSIDPLARIVARVRQDRPGIPIIVFAANVGAQVTRYAALTEAEILSIDKTTSLAWAADQLHPMGKALQGNLDPALLVAGGAALDGAVDHIVAQMKPRSIPFIFNLGQGILPQTSPDHVARMIARLRSA